MRVVVVGATGNVGTAVLRRLAAVRADDDGVTGRHAAGDAGHHAAGDAARDAAGVQIVGVARRLPDLRAEPYAAAVWHAVDVGAADAVDQLTAVFQGADAVIHLAWALQPTHDIPAQHRTNVTGTANVLAAVARAEVPQVVVASSVGAYRGVDVDGKHTPVDESWPADGISTATYSIHKADNEAAMDAFEAEHPSVTVTRLRPGLIFQRDAAAEIRGLFLGHLVPMSIVRWIRWLVLPLPYPFVFQAVHADDVADAYWRAVDRRAAGAFNIAASPVLNPPRLARLRHARCRADPAAVAARDRDGDVAAAVAADGRRVDRHRGRGADHADRPCPVGARMGGPAHLRRSVACTRGRVRGRCERSGVGAAPRLTGLGLGVAGVGAAWSPRAYRVLSGVRGRKF
ncbi:NAD-dependent epimerase/dehydratase family protein [Curtobacterium sp. MCBA15_005]|uniref:NAD-dependent epimerase/dehydratase family protein n=1 Tax=Curtobacterium sp. MCBA15_005 TaxID=1898734 RepID=UPI000A4F60C7|nr:NAD-dependent epimerase/dehydratase family protein [Curtobacterium sp. MCBA15_005]